MQGGGTDMYDLIPDLHEDNRELYSTGKKFWVGVIEGVCPSPPVPRNRTKCYTSAPVYKFFDEYIFNMNRKTDDRTWCKDYYAIPEKELIFIQ